METTVFLSRPQHEQSIKNLSWNVNGVKTKLEKGGVQNLLLNYDLISSNEVKTPLQVNFPGYVSYKSDVMGSSERGGTVLMVKNYLVKEIVSIDTSVKEQVWVEFRCVPKYLFGFCYIPPSDSEYYSHYSFAAIQEKLKTSVTCHEFCIIGDMNSKFGHLVSARTQTNFTYFGRRGIS